MSTTHSEKLGQSAASLMIDGYIYREAVQEDLPGMAALFSRHNYGPRKQDWLKWKYLDNPDGPARPFIVMDGESNIVGIVTFVPRTFFSPASGKFMVMQSTNIFVDPDVRKRGVYSKLEPFSRVRVGAPKMGFPNRRAIEFGLRGGWHVLARLDKWWFPLASGQAPGMKSGRFLLAIVNALLRAYAFLWLGMPPGDVSMRPVERFEKDYEIDTPLIHGIRSAEYLNWRFIDNPMGNYSVYEFVESGASIGYCAYVIENGAAEILDFVTNRHRQCLCLLVDHCRNEGMTRLKFRSSGLRLGRFGFIRRRSGRHVTACDVPPGFWLLTLGDSDY